MPCQSKWKISPRSGQKRKSEPGQLAKLQALIGQFSVVPPRMVQQFVDVLGDVALTGQRELVKQAGAGMSRLRAGLQIPSESELSALRQRINRLEKKISTVSEPK